MTSDDAHTGLVGPERRAQRQRRLLVAAVAGVLLWSGVSYLANIGETVAPVSVLPGAAADGSAAEVQSLTDTVTASKGGSTHIVGVKFARVDVALATQDEVALSFAWQNPSEFAKKTGNGSWQVRMGLYYPVHTGACAGGAPSHAVTVSLTAGESWSGSAATFCAYRDTAAVGPGAVVTPGDADRGTQLLASNYMVGTLRPQTTVSSPVACTASGTTACLPAGVGADRRQYFVIGSLLNPGGNVPQGQVDNLMDMDLHVRALKVGG